MTDESDVLEKKKDALRALRKPVIGAAYYDIFNVPTTGKHTSPATVIVPVTKDNEPRQGGD